MPTFSIIARDAHSPLVRNEIWTHLGDRWPNIFNVPRPIIGIISRKNVIEYILNLERWGEARKVLQNRIQANPQALKELLDRSEEWGKEMNEFTRSIHESSLSSWSAEKLSQAYQAFTNFQARQYSVGALLPLLEIGGESFLETLVHDIVNSRVEESKRGEVYRILTTPIKDSFSLEQEKALLELAQNLSEAGEAIDQLSDEAKARIMEHAKQYGWVYYVYEGPAFGEAQFTEFLRDALTTDISPKTKLEALIKERQELIEIQAEWIDCLGQNDQERTLLKLASEFVWSKPRRKDYQSRSYFHVEAFYREWARRTGVSLRHARAATIEQINAGLNGEKVELNILESQYQLHVAVNNDDQVQLLFGKEAQSFIDTHVAKSEEVQEGSVDKLEGSTAYPGHARGKVKIVNVPEDMQNFSKGDILVAIATTPSIVPAMKKAAAILTDEGGLTCHAAIVSRELKIPCVVGLKMVTRVLKDGDEVEVDAGKGTVKRVNVEPA